MSDFKAKMHQNQISAKAHIPLVAMVGELLALTQTP